MKQCENETQHTGKYCGSYAVNSDPELKLCDVCYAYRRGQEDRQRTIATGATVNESTDDGHAPGDDGGCRYCNWGGYGDTGGDRPCPGRAIANVAKRQCEHCKRQHGYGLPCVGSEGCICLTRADLPCSIHYLDEAAIARTAKGDK